MRSSPRTALWAIATMAVVGLWAASATAQPSPSPTPTASQPGQASEQDRDYLMEAHQANLAEIASGKAAQEKGTSQVVKDLAAKLVEDHTKLDEQVQSVAQQLGVDLPTEPSAAQKATAALLSVVPAGQQWDQLWVGSQLAAHESSKDNAQDEVAMGTDAAVTDLATQAGPVIQGHLDELTRIAPQFGIQIQR